MVLHDIRQNVSTNDQLGAPHIKKRLNESVFETKRCQIFSLLQQGYSVHQTHASLFSLIEPPITVNAMRMWLRRGSQMNDYKVIRSCRKSTTIVHIDSVKNLQPGSDSHIKGVSELLQSTVNAKSNYTQSTQELPQSKPKTKEELLAILDQITEKHERKTLLQK